MSDRILELYTMSTREPDVDWETVVTRESCAFLSRKCLKVRKSQPDISIGTCSVAHGMKSAQQVVICPFRFLERNQIFVDCLHLLTNHEPGNELHRIAEVEIPGGSVDYFLVSTRHGKVADFVGIELQAVDTTGTLWPHRQHFLQSVGVPVDPDFDTSRNYGMNWKMTAKTTLMQLHHKVETLERLNKHFVLVLQDRLLDYMQREFKFGHIESAKLGDAMQFHAYTLAATDQQRFRLSLTTRFSTNAAGIASALELQRNPNVELEAITAMLQARLTSDTLLPIL